jgi:hypothetical protein
MEWEQTVLLELCKTMQLPEAVVADLVVQMEL